MTTKEKNHIEATKNLKYEYIPRINWSPLGDLILSTLNRNQDSLNLVRFNPNKNSHTSFIS